MFIMKILLKVKSSSFNHLTWCLGRGWPAAAAAEIIAAYCSGVGLCDGAGSLFGLLVGGGTATGPTTRI